MAARVYLAAIFTLIFGPGNAKHHTDMHDMVSLRIYALDMYRRYGGQGVNLFHININFSPFTMLLRYIRLCIRAVESLTYPCMSGMKIDVITTYSSYIPPKFEFWAFFF